MQMRRSTAVPLVLLGAFALVGYAPTPGDPAPSEGQEAQEMESELSCFLRGATMEEAAERTSPLRELRFSYDGGEALLCYGAPSARGREIMGGLVPYAEPWRTGANEPTAIHLTAPASVGGVELEPGTYALYTIPGEEEWQVFLNSSYERWGIPITDEVRATEVGSFTVAPEATEEMTETLTFDYADGDIVMKWEHTQLRIPFDAGEM